MGKELLNQGMGKVTSWTALFQTKGSKIVRTKVEGSLSTLKVQKFENEEGFFGSVHKKLLSVVYICFV